MRIVSWVRWIWGRWTNKEYKEFACQNGQGVGFLVLDTDLARSWRLPS